MLSFDDVNGFYSFRNDCIDESKKLFQTYGFDVASCYKAIETEIAPWNNWYINPHNRQTLGKNYGSNAVGTELKNYCLQLVIAGLKRHYNDLIIGSPISYYIFKFRKGQRDVLVSDIDIESDSLEAYKIYSVMADEISFIPYADKSNQTPDYVTLFKKSLDIDNQEISEFLKEMDNSYARQHLTRPLVELFCYNLYHIELDCPKRVL